MTDLSSFRSWLVSATRAAILVARDRVYQSRRHSPERRSEAIALLKRIAQELAARGEYDRRCAA